MVKVLESAILPTVLGDMSFVKLVYTTSSFIKAETFSTFLRFSSVF